MARVQSKLSSAQEENEKMQGTNTQLQESLQTLQKQHKEVFIASPREGRSEFETAFGVAELGLTINNSMF